MKKWLAIFLSILCIIGVVQLANADGVELDFPPPIPTDPPVTPYDMPIMIGFDQGPSQIPWTDVQRQGAQWAIDQLSQYFRNTPAFIEGLTGITLQWAGSDFFRDWSTVPGFDPQSMYLQYGWDFNKNYWDKTIANACSNTPFSTAPRPWGDLYAMNEVIFNYDEEINWHFDPYTQPEPNEKDFGSTVLHELIHMLGVLGHSEDPNSPIYKASGGQLGVRKEGLTADDINKLRGEGYDAYDPRVPEPATIVSFLLGAAGFAVRKLSTKNKVV